MLLAAGYVILVGFAGWRFVYSSRALRQHWRRRLYRFLPRKYYHEMVVKPTIRSTLDYPIAATLSAVCLIMVWIGLSVTEPRLKPKSPSNIDQGDVDPAAPFPPIIFVLKC